MHASRPSSPALHGALRLFCLGSFYELGRDVEAGAPVPAELDGHRSGSGESLYEYRVRLDAFVEQRAERLLVREDAIEALTALKEEPGAGIFARANGRGRLGEDEALSRTVLLPLLVTTAERCNGFDWDDEAFDRTYLELERELRGEARRYLARAPLVGLTAASAFELSPGTVVRPATDGERFGVAAIPGDLPEAWGREVDRALVLEIALDVDPCDPSIPDGPMLAGKAITALRLTVPGAIAAGPVVFEQLNGFDYSQRPVPELARHVPVGEPTRLDRFRGALAVRVYERLVSGAADIDTLEAIERWEVALFRQGPSRAEELREGLVMLLGGDEGPWAAAMRGAALVGDTADERARLVQGLIGLLDGDGPGTAAEDVLRRALIETILASSRDELLSELDRTLLGLDEPAMAATPRRSTVDAAAGHLTRA